MVIDKSRVADSAHTSYSQTSDIVQIMGVSFPLPAVMICSVRAQSVGMASYTVRWLIEGRAWANCRVELHYVSQQSVGLILCRIFGVYVLYMVPFTSTSPPLPS